MHSTLGRVTIRGVHGWSTHGRGDYLAWTIIIVVSNGSKTAFRRVLNFQVQLSGMGPLSSGFKEDPGFRAAGSKFIF